VVISASRRTDIPAFYADWFMNRVREGWCSVPNPFNSNQISEISLRPDDVEAIVFWSKNPQPILGHLDELDQRGFLYYFLITLNDYPAIIEPGVPKLPARVASFKQLAEKLGSERVVWRYDPIIISTATPYSYQAERFGDLCRVLAGSTRRVIISLVDYYRKTERRLSEIETNELRFDRDAAARPETRELLSEMSRVAGDHGIEIQSCAQSEDFSDVGVPAGSCIDGELIRRLGREVRQTKAKGQRDACRCIESRDIGINDTCIHGCRYCYATRNHDVASRRHAEHKPEGAALWDGG
jgi:DNA repair photolyase